ncbi:MAG: 3-deoxy-7-phosphoheptulonate synthase, partial [Elusimicrobia bacterium]|nr:3-deoxy-7-phosphoheptulonate synthase [Elusimicrobiota bacterium]
DGAQALHPDDFAQLMGELAKVCPAVGRRLATQPPLPKKGK